MIRRRGEGFTELERHMLADFLEDEIVIQGLFMLASSRAALARRSDVWTRIDDQSSRRAVIRDWLPIVMPGLDPEHPRRKRSIVLHDCTTVSYQVAGPETSMATETVSWYCSVGAKEGRKLTTDVRPTLVKWEYLGASPRITPPEAGVDWTFYEPEEVWALIQDDVQHLAELERQAGTIRELQRAVIFLTDPRRLPPSGA